MSSEQLVGIRKCLYRSGSRSQPRQGPKPGRKRRWRGFPGAPSGAGHISADRANHTGFRGEGLRESAGAVGDMVGGGSSVFF